MSDAVDLFRVRLQLAAIFASIGLLQFAVMHAISAMARFAHAVERCQFDTDDTELLTQSTQGTVVVGLAGYEMLADAVIPQSAVQVLGQGTALKQ